MKSLVEAGIAILIVWLFFQWQQENSSALLAQNGTAAAGAGGGSSPSTSPAKSGCCCGGGSGGSGASAGAQQVVIGNAGNGTNFFGSLESPMPIVTIFEPSAPVATPAPTKPKSSIYD